MKPSDHTTRLLRRALEELRLAQRSAREAAQAVQTALEALTDTQLAIPDSTGRDTAAQPQRRQAK